MTGARRTFFAGGETFFRWLGSTTHSAVLRFDRVADWFGERAR